jgi:hypothetical protein
VVPFSIVKVQMGGSLLFYQKCARRLCRAIVKFAVEGGERIKATTCPLPHVGKADSAGCGQGGTSNLKPEEYADKGKPYLDPRPLA